MGRARRGILLTTTLAMSALMATSGAASAAAPALVPTVESTTERVLQSVAVSMGPDGTTTGVGSSVVRTDGGVDDAETSDEAYSPQEVVGDLPVRVLTSWRTSEGAGTDLSDLQGYTGRIAIDVTVQNLTVKPEVLSYDAAGTSRQQAALVGSPLTITAATSLGDLDAGRVVTDHRGTGANVTNGVLGKGADGTTVQWAALLAPPILSSSAELSLVVDARDFDVPTIDLSVQPGLVTDPSIGGLVDAAFDPAASDERELQERTIELVGEVNTVLARASSTISDVRNNLTSSAETLGTQTVADLQSSTQSVTSNMSALDSALQSLRADLSSTLESTGSSAVAELDQAVSVVDQLLGDTSAQAPAAAVRGTGCETSVAGPQKSGSVYGNLLQVASQLDGYAKATDECKGALQASILETIGPEKPSDDLCTRTGDGGEPQSVTCSLYQTQQTFEVAAETLRVELLGDGTEENEGVIGLLEPELYQDARDAANDLMEIATLEDPEDDLDSVRELIDAINARRKVMVDAIVEANDALKEGGAVQNDLATVGSGLTALRTEATSVLTALEGMKASSAAASDEICGLVDAGTVVAEDVADTLAHIEVQCDGKKPVPTQEVSTIDQQIAALEAGLDDSEDAVAALERVVAAVDEVAPLLDKAALASGETGPPTDEEGDKLSVLFQKLLGEGGAFDKLEAKTGELNVEIGKIEALANDVANLRTKINTAIDQAKARIGTGVQGGTDDVLEAGGNASTELGTMFARSSSGLRSAAGDVTRNGKESVNEQKSAFEQARDASADRVSGTVEDGLSQINTGVSGSTRNMEAATALLTADLRKVLLDLGQREVGGGGLLGAMATNAATARTADYQLALASNKATSYSNVRGRDIDGLMLRQAQTDAAMQMLIDMPAFQLDLPSGSQHRTVYSFTIGDN